MSSSFFSVAASVEVNWLALSGRFASSSPKGGALGKNKLFCVDCQSLALRERWQCEALTERVRALTKGIFL